jgi:hypothetical protein
MDIQLFINTSLNIMTNNISLTSIFSLYNKINRQIILKENNRSKTYQINIYRAQGGKIRIEKDDQEYKITTIINGLGAIEKTELLKEKSPTLVKFISLDKDQIIKIKRLVRLYPRNFLAHINEYNYEFKGLQTINGESFYVLDFIDEQATYYFDPSTFLCLSLIDRKNNSTTHYSNYKQINGIFTPLEEKTVSETLVQTDSIEKIEYNLKLEDHTFDLS